MSKITKKQLQRAIQCQKSRIDGLVGLLAKKGYYDKEPEPQLKQLDQSVFNGLDEKWRFAAVDTKGGAFLFSEKPAFSKTCIGFWFAAGAFGCKSMGYGYDASNWQNSLIERDDIAKELLEVDLSIELVGSELCRAMINRGDKIVLCIVKDYDYENDIYYDAITRCSGDYFKSTISSWRYATPINNQGEPLTAAEAGL